MGVISFRVDDELKKKMESIKTINWSEVFRQFITERVAQELKKEIDPIRRVRGSQLAKEIQERYSRDEEWDSVAELRKWRDQRK